MHIQTEGLVLRETPYKDADKMLTVLTRKLGKLSVRARGARRRGSSLVASTQLLAYSDFQIFEHGGRYVLDDAETLDLFFALRQDITSFSLASYFSELLDAVCTEGEPHEELLKLGVFICRVLGDGKRRHELVKAAFELRLMSMLGFEPYLDCCGVCGEAPDTACFHITRGTIHCAACAVPDGQSMPLTAGVYTAMRHIVSCPLQKLCAFTLDNQDTLLLASVCERYAAAMTDRGYASLKYYYSMRGMKYDR